VDTEDKIVDLIDRRGADRRAAVWTAAPLTRWQTLEVDAPQIDVLRFDRRVVDWDALLSTRRPLWAPAPGTTGGV